MGITKQYKVKFAKDLGLNIVALIVMNLVIQLVVYPYINRVLGEDAFGTILYLMSIIAVVSGSFGGALNNVRLVTKPQYESKNGDYDTLLLLFCGITVAVAIGTLAFLKALTPIDVLFFSLLAVLTLCRYYFDVAFRINLNYVLFFITYILISVGYLAGTLLFHLSEIWYLALISGEAAAIIFVLCKSDIVRHPLQCSKNRGRVWRDVWIVALSYIISNFFLNIDRILLLNILGGDAVTTYYTASVLGKTLALLIGPLTGVLIAHLANYDGQLSRKAYIKIVIITIGLSVLAFIGCALVSPVLIKWLYPNVYLSASGLIGVGTLGQVLYFSSSLLLAVILRFCKTKYQFLVQVIYGIIYIGMAIPMAIFNGIYGFAYATVIANTIRFIIIIIVGVRALGAKHETIYLNK